MRPSLLPLLAASTLMMACASAAPSPAASAENVAATRSHSDVITREELDDPALTGADALTAVRRLRPRFLNVRGSTSVNSPDAGNVHVSLDNSALVGTDVLTTMRVESIAEIRYLDAVSATQRFGSLSRAGPVIVVIRR